MSRHLGALAVACILLCIAPSALADGRQVGPESTGWWQVGSVALVTAAGLAEGELLVDGFGSDDGSRHAVAALSFALDGASTGSTITVPVTSSTLPGASVAVCAITVAFEPAYGGAADDVPDHDCTRSAVGTVDDDGDLVIEDVSALGDDEHLRALLVPNGPGRIVLDGANAMLSAAAVAGGPPIHAPIPAAAPIAVAPPTAAPSAVGPVASIQPGVAEEPAVQPEMAVPAVRPATVFPGFTPRADDSRARLVTAIVLTVSLGLFTVLNRGGASRLRPGVVPWRRTDRSARGAAVEAPADEPVT